MRFRLILEGEEAVERERRREGAGIKQATKGRKGKGEGAEPVPVERLFFFHPRPSASQPFALFHSVSPLQLLHKRPHEHAAAGNELCGGSGDGGERERGEK